jgi:hypothetical protein
MILIRWDGVGRMQSHDYLDLVVGSAFEQQLEIRIHRGSGP